MSLKCLNSQLKEQMFAHFKIISRKLVQTGYRDACQALKKDAWCTRSVFLAGVLITVTDKEGLYLGPPWLELNDLEE